LDLKLFGPQYCRRFEAAVIKSIWLAGCAMDEAAVPSPRENGAEHRSTVEPRRLAGWPLARMFFD
jgi:hypothetical protein